MGIDILFTVERRREDGRWERAEEIIRNKPNWILLEDIDANPDLREFLDEDVPLTLLQSYVHAQWQTPDARNRWLRYLDLPARGLPTDACTESREYLQFYTEENGRSFLTLAELQKLDWSKAIERWDNNVNFVFSIRDNLLARLHSLGGPDDVRLIYGWNI